MPGRPSHVFEWSPIDTFCRQQSGQWDSKFWTSNSVMLNARALSERLTKHVDPYLYPLLFIMDPDGQLFAYSRPANMKQLRDQATLVSMAWKQQEEALNSRAVGETRSPSSPSSGTIYEDSLETLTIESDTANVLVRALQPKLLLVMVGGTPPGRKISLTMTPETPGDSRYPSPIPSRPMSPIEARPSSSQDSLRNLNTQAHALSSSASDGSASQKDVDIMLGALHIQRKRLDKLTGLIREDFRKTGFLMPANTRF
ncbi:hypothetical protein LTS18_004014 [Coniosporium uncinatum]|uniref:Uncharacterized protein n=1 Tax=Coniosporium uncinatum TaxID=93489 RepID=A0ACC3DSK3_9PEZI|nr:hypothetical protein LTS18_004014 [Coniosporium uncinatum]